MRFRLTATHGLIVAAVALAPGPAGATDDDATLFERATSALERGAPTEAIENLELLADRGVRRPNASFNRALAYIARAESPREQPGDLGRAAAALEETVVLAGGDDAAEDLLEQVREEIARRRVRQGSAPISVSAGIGWAVTELLPENAWSVGAGVGSLLLSVGLVLWLFLRRARVPSALLMGVGTLLLLAFGGLALAARHRRMNYAPAVVVGADTRLTDLAGRGPSPEAAHHDSVPEGARVALLERRGHRTEIEWDGAIGWVPSEAVLALPRK